ncbi:MAG: hypothetical protein GYB65_11585 [Chloroflexi bacterium]|nr:hypothetical protein [Chloroflexota bacterium]
MDVKVVLFGPPHVLYRGDPIDLRVKKAVALLAYLVTTGKAHHRERLATLLWPESKPDVARTSLRQAVQAIRATPLAAVLITSRTSLELHSDVTSDVRSFAAYTADFSCDQPTPGLEVVARLQAAEALYQGEFMQDFSIPGSREWDDWHGLRRIEFEYQATCVIAALTRYYVQHELADSGLQMATRWLALDPLNEEAHHLAMQLYVLNRQVERALEQYYMLVRLLERDYQRLPGAEVRLTYNRIRRGEFSQPAAVAASSDTRQIRSLLPKPVRAAAEYEPALTLLQPALKQASQQPLFAVIHDEGQQNAAGLIACLAHDDATHQLFADGILWGALRTADDLDGVLRLWLDAIRVSVLRSTSTLDHLAWQFHNGQRGKRLLFLLENVRETHHARVLIPGYAGCALVVTTPAPEVAAALAGKADVSLSLPLGQRAAQQPRRSPHPHAHHQRSQS